jgi:hypothetical protein
MTRLDRRESNIRKISATVEKASTPSMARGRTHHVAANQSEPLPYTDPKDHHHISREQRHSLDIGTFLQENAGDPAIKVCPTFNTIHFAHSRIPFATGLHTTSQGSFAGASVGPRI